jgi:hypothetical protein
MEPRLGLALCTWRETGTLQELRALIETLPQVRDLISHRIAAAVAAELDGALDS